MRNNKRMTGLCMSSEMLERTKYTGHRGLRSYLSSRKLTAVAELADSLQLLHLWIHPDFSYQSHTSYALLAMTEHHELSISLSHACLMWTPPMSSVCLGTPIVFDVTFAEWIWDLVFFPLNPSFPYVLSQVLAWIAVWGSSCPLLLPPLLLYSSQTFSNKPCHL